MSGRVVHFEVPYDDAERAHGFYREVFGWQIQPISELQYDIASTGPADDQGRPSESGYTGGGMSRRSDVLSRPVITIEVEDIDATLEKVRANGGATVGKKLTVADMGFAAYFTDSEGNLTGIWQNAT